jgi:MFS family permease
LTARTSASPPPQVSTRTSALPKGSLPCWALFFLGYFFFQIPGAIYAERRSVRKLIFVCLILWGACASLTGMVSNIPMLAAIRFILGVVEAAVMPAMLIYISNWFTKSERSRANTFLILGNRLPSCGCPWFPGI